MNNEVNDVDILSMPMDQNHKQVKAWLPNDGGIPTESLHSINWKSQWLTKIQVSTSYVKSSLHFLRNIIVFKLDILVLHYI